MIKDRQFGNAALPRLSEPKSMTSEKDDLINVTTFYQMNNCPINFAKYYDSNQSIFTDVKFVKKLALDFNAYLTTQIKIIQKITDFI